METVVQGFINNIAREILTPIITLISLAAFALFVYGVVEFIRNADNDEKRRSGQQHMIWGIIGLAIIFGANAIIKILTSTLGITG
jgi:uncharacterized membrane protein YidH (DUF202 family)